MSATYKYSPQHERRNRQLAQLLVEHAREELVASDTSSEEEDREVLSTKKDQSRIVRICMPRCQQISKEMVRQKYLDYSGYGLAKTTVCQTLALQFDTSLENILSIIKKV